MKKVIEFIIAQKVDDYNELPRLLEPLKEYFDIRDHNGNEAATELLMTIVNWEMHPEIYDSLEKILEKKFVAKKKL